MPKILYVISEDWNVCSHFLPMLHAARDMGLEVVVATRVRDHRKVLEQEGFRIVPMESERRSLSPFGAASNFLKLYNLIRREAPDIVHVVSIRNVVVGGLASRLAGRKSLVVAPIGLGHLWIEKGPIETMLRPIVRFIVSRILATSQTVYLFENPDDPAELGLSPSRHRIELVGGAGVSPESFPLTPEPPSPPVRVAVVSRMTYPKGIPESIAAIRRAREMGADVELHLYGAPDPSNRRSMTEAELRAATGDGISWHGPTGDVAAVWRDNHVALLLSHREGLPRVLVEAAACGRPIIATDVTGCRHFVRNGVDGVLVPRGDVDAAAKAIIRLAASEGYRSSFGKSAHARFCKEFAEVAVRNCLTRIYTDLAMRG